MKAWSFWQPWANCIIEGEKLIETRGHNIKMRGPIAIHATQYKKLPCEVWEAVHEAIQPERPFINSRMYFMMGCKGKVGTFGAVLGTVEIVDCVSIESLYGTQYDTPKERALGDWTPGRFGIILQNPRKFARPFPHKGKQGIWEWKEAAT